MIKELKKSVMNIAKEIVRFLRKTDEVDTISKVTKEFLEQNDTSVILDAIDNNRSKYRDMACGDAHSGKAGKHVVKKNGKSYVVRKVGSHKLSVG